MTAVGIVGSVISKYLLPAEVLDWAGSFTMPEFTIGGLLRGVETAVRDLV